MCRGVGRWAGRLPHDGSWQTARPALACSADDLARTRCKSRRSKECAASCRAASVQRGRRVRVGRLLMSSSRGHEAAGQMATQQRLVGPPTPAQLGWQPNSGWSPPTHLLN